MMSTVEGKVDVGMDLVQVPLFTELLELIHYEDGEFEWKEFARWIKYQEIVEEEGDRWSKPHISTISLRGLLHLRKLIRNGINLMDVSFDNEGSLEQIVDAINKSADLEFPKAFKNLVLKKHRHQFEGNRKLKASIGGVIKQLLVQKLEEKKGTTTNARRSSMNSTKTGSRLSEESESDHDLQASREDLDTATSKKPGSEGKINTYLTKKLPSGSEGAIILAGKHKIASKPISVFVRLRKKVSLHDLPEVDIPTRFIYIVILPTDSNVRSVDIGASLGTAFSDPHFKNDVFKAKDCQDLIMALDEFTDGIKALPKSWDTSRYIEPPSSKPAPELFNLEDEVDEDRRAREKSGLVRSGRLFGGLISDIQRKKEWYFSDFKDAFHPQSISTVLFMYFAILAPIVAFGALLGKATKSRIATMESLISGLIVGVGFGLFSGQPLVLLGSTGPVYAFENILYSLCDNQGWDYLSLRLWIGIWIGIFLLILVAFDASAIVCYITRFTEEIFATLIAFIFIFNSFKNLFSINVDYSFNPLLNETVCVNSTDPEDPPHCPKAQEPNVFLMSVLLFIGAFSISFGLKSFRNSSFFPTWLRVIMSDFAVVIAILTMTALDYLAGVNTPKLTVPSEFKPTWEGRDWVIAHALIVSEHALVNQWWVDVFLAPVLALLATILIFMDQQITAVIINRKDNKLVKGCGYHLDLFVLAFLIVILSLFGLPWFVAATVESRNHLMSLSRESKESAPGEKPKFLGIREQRVTTIMIGILIGLSIFITPVLALIPMPILYGVFLFMGVRSLGGLQFFDRLLLFFMPIKYQPDCVFLKYVPLKRVHFFTIIQLASLVGLWLIKSFPETSIAFPLMLVVICFIRFCCGSLFSRKELRVLDDLLPGKSIVKRGATAIPSTTAEVSRMDPDERDSLLPVPRERTRKVTLNEELDNVDVVMDNRKNQLPSILSRSDIPQMKPRRICFGRIDENEPFVALNTNEDVISVESLISSIKSTFEPLSSTTIIAVWKRGLGNFDLIIDNTLIEEFICSREAFTIEMENKGSNKYVAKLIQNDVNTYVA